MPAKASEMLKNVCLVVENVENILKSTHIDATLLTKENLNTLFRNATVIENLFTRPEGKMIKDKVNEYLSLNKQGHCNVCNHLLAKLLCVKFSGVVGLRVINEYKEVFGESALESAVCQLEACNRARNELLSLIDEGQCSSDDIAAPFLLDNWQRLGELDKIKDLVSNMIDDGKLSNLISLMSLKVNQVEAGKLLGFVSEAVIAQLKTSLHLSVREDILSDPQKLVTVITMYPNFVRFLFEALRTSESLLTSSQSSETFRINSTENDHCFDYQQCLKIVKGLCEGGHRPLVVTFIRNAGHRAARNFQFWQSIEHDLIKLQ